MEHLKYPIGRFTCPTEINATHLEEWKATIKTFPRRLKETLEGLSTKQLNWNYRPQGWKIKQVVHHLADSHMNALIRFKLTLTEDTPVIRPYEEALWAQHADDTNDNLESSLKIIEGVHERWLQLMENMDAKDWEKIYIHPEHQKLFTLKESLGMYAWHCNHHLAHIEQALSYEGNFNL